MGSGARPVPDSAPKGGSVISEIARSSGSSPERYRDEPDVSENTGLLAVGADAGDGAGAGTDDPAAPVEATWAGDAEFQHLAPWRRPSIWWLLGPYSLFTLAFGGSIVPKLNLIIDLVCNKYFADRSAADPSFVFAPIVFGGDNQQCRVPGVQRNVATFNLALNVIVGLLSAYSAPKLGGLSDRFGRKRMMVICSLGGVANEAVVILAAKYPSVVDYRWLLFGSLFDGLTGSFTAGSVLSHSYTSDCTRPSRRSVSIAYLHACLFSGLAFGPLLAAYLVKKTGSLVSIFYITLGCHVIFIVFVQFVIPESLSRRKQLVAREKHAKEREAAASVVPPALVSNTAWIPFGTSADKAIHAVRTANPLAPLRTLLPPGRKNASVRRNLVLLAAVDTILIGSAMSVGTITILYSEYVFGWGTVESSRFVSLVSSVRFFGLMLIFPLVNYLFRTRPAARRRRLSSDPGVEKNAGADEIDLWVLRAALLSEVFGLVGYAVVRTEGLFIASAVMTAMGGLGSATIQSSISKHVPSEFLGRLLGAIGLLHALSRVVVPVALNGLYAATVDSFPQAIFVMLAGVFILVLLAALLVRPHVFLEEEEGGRSKGGNQLLRPLL